MALFRVIFVERNDTLLSFVLFKKNAICLFCVLHKRLVGKQKQLFFSHQLDVVLNDLFIAVSL